MTNIHTIIKKIINGRDERSIMSQRRQELTNMVDQHGLDVVAMASGLKESTISQYLRDKDSKISQSAIDQANFVFSHPNFIAAKK